MISFVHRNLKLRLGWTAAAVYMKNEM